MATEGHRGGQDKDHQQKNKAEIEKELKEIREKIEKLTLKMQREAKVHWTYEWPLRKKVKWHVQELSARKQQQVVRRWLRHSENLSDTKQEMVYICEPEVGRTLSDEEGRSVKGLINYQEDRDEFSNCWVGNEMRSIEDLIDCQEGSSENSYCQVGNEMRSIEDLIDCEEGGSENPYWQVGNEMRSIEDLIDCEEGGKFILAGGQ
jgi:hypothetical protein